MHKIKKIIFLLLLFYVNFNFVFDSFHTLHDILNLSIALIIVLMNLNLLKSKVKILHPALLLSITILMFIGIYSLIHPIIMSTFDFTFFRNIFFGTAQKVLLNVAIIIVYFRFFKESATFNRFVNYYLSVLVLYLVITFVLMLIPNLKDFWLSLLYIAETDIARLNQPQYYTRVGIDGFAGFVQTFRFSLGVILSVFLVIDIDEKYNKISWKHILLIGLLTIGTLFYGRIGSAAAFVAIFILLFYFFTKARNINKAIIIIVGIVLGVMAIGLISMFNEAVRTWFVWAFEMIISLVLEGEISSTSTDILFNQMYFVPELQSFLIGTGLYTNPISGSYYMGTDVSFLRSILFYGFVPTLLMYTAVIVLIILLIKYVSKNGRKSAGYLLLMLIMLLVVFEIKGEIYHIYYSILVPFYISKSYENEWLNG